MPSVPARRTPRAPESSSIADLRKICRRQASGGLAAAVAAWPIIDGWVIPDDQYKLYEARRYNDTPILVGYNSDEGASFSPPRRRRRNTSPA